MNELTVFGSVSATMILVIIMIFIIAVIVLPFIVWDIHKQSTRATKELIKLNKIIESFKPKQQPKDRLAEQSSKDTQPAEISKENQIEPLIKGRLPGQAHRRRKVFYKPDGDLLEQKDKTS